MASTFCDTRPIFLLPGDDFISAGISSKRTDRYQINAADDSTALSLLKTAAPMSRVVDSITLDAPVVYNITKEKTPGRYLGTAEYSHPGRDDRQGPADLTDDTIERLAFDFSAGSKFFSWAISQDRYPNGGAAPDARDVGLNINVRYDGAVDGLDWSAPSDSFTIDRVIPQATVTNAWLKTLIGKRLSKNDGTFRGLDAGECLFLGFSGTQQSNGDFPFSFKFAVQMNETSVSSIAGFNIEDSITIKGFDYAWVMSRPVAEGSTDNEITGVITPEIVGAYVAELFPDADFGTLGVDT